MKDIKQQDFVKAGLVGSAAMLEHNSGCPRNTPDNLRWFHQTQQNSSCSYSCGASPVDILSIEIGYEHYPGIKLLHTSPGSGEYCHVLRTPQSADLRALEHCRFVDRIE